MADTPYKLQIKIGQSEFSAEGPEATVKDAYDRFLEAIRAATAPVAAQSAAGHLSLVGGTPTLSIDSEATRLPLDRVFKRDGDIVSLRHLPSTANKIADSAILLIYGYMKVAALDEVPITKLNEGLRESGLNIQRLDRYLGVHQSLYRKGGQKSGGRFTLNNLGLRQAEEWLKDWN